MESTNPPGPSFPAPRRVFTAPVYSAAPQSPPSSQSAAGIVDTLYAHPSVKIVSFTAGTRPVALSPRTAGSSTLDVEPGSLPSFSQFETTIAAGHFRIYRAPGSVAFLSCGSALQPILPKSQAWCVDEASSKFILQIRRPQYWRIEVPVISPEDVQRAQLLREVFDKILQFEKTECPFSRSFTVELPEPPLTPVKKRPWTPAPNSLASLPPTPVTPVDVARLYRSAPKEFISGPDTQEPMSDSEKSSVGTARGSESNADEQSVSSTDDDFERTAQSHHDKDGPQSPKDKTNPRLPKPLRQGGFLASRCVTAPPQLTLVASPPSKLRNETPAEPSPRSPAAPRLQLQVDSPAASQLPLHNEPSTPLPPSPPMSSPGSPLPSSCPPETAGEPTELGTPGIAVTTPNTPDSWSVSPTELAPSHAITAISPPPSADTCISSPTTTSTIPGDTLHPILSIPEADEQEHEVEEEEPEPIPLTTSTSHTAAPTVHRPQTRHRATTTASSSSNISPNMRAQSFTNNNNTNNKKLTVARLPLVVINATCEILMSPPSHLLNLMLKVAARIAAGEWRGYMFGMGEGGESIPVHWDWSDDEDHLGQMAHRHRHRHRQERDHTQDHENSLAVGGWRGDNDWSIAGRMTGVKMAGSFPESDDEGGDDHINLNESVGAADTDSPELPVATTPDIKVDSDSSRGWAVD